MKTDILRKWLFALGMAVVACAVPGGCDSGTGDDSELDNYFVNHPYVSDPRDGGSAIVTITPESAVVNTVGGQAVFSFNGGTGPYSWDVSDPSKGSISGSGAQGVYTATVVGNNDVIAYDRNGNAAIAKVSGSSGGSAGGDLTISASPSELTANGSMSVLAASGGVEPYSWSFATGAKGGFVGADTGSSVVYVRNAAGDNAVTVTDATGIRASIVIAQPL
jgi:hypothetical protein